MSLLILLSNMLLGMGPANTSPSTTPSKKLTIELLPIPNDGVTEALFDLLTIPPHTRPYIRYIFINQNEHKLFAKVAKIDALSLGMISRSIFPNIRPIPISAHVLRVNSLEYAPKGRGNDYFLKAWEELRFDPDFNQLITKDEINLKDNLKDNLKAKSEAKKETVDIIRLNSYAIDEINYQVLQQETHSLAPIVSYKYLHWRALSSNSGKGLYKIVWGGLYYQLRGIRSNERKVVATSLQSPKDKTDIDLYLEDAGILIKADDLFNHLRSDQRVAIFKSGVTGKPRRVDWFHSPDSRDGTGVVSITHDLSSDDVDIGTHPLYNLLISKPAAFEAIREGTNGFPVYAIFDGQQKLLDFADANKVVADRTIPDPFPPVLVPPISCLACHGGSRGWMSLTNDAKQLTKYHFNVIGDLSQRDIFGSQTIERIAGLYTGNFDKSMGWAKDNFDETTLRCGGPFVDKDNQYDPLTNTKVAWSEVTASCRGYWYDPVTPKIALEELGVKVTEGHEVKFLKFLLAPDNNPTIVVDHEPFILENPVIAALKEGMSVPRWDWDLQKSFAAVRVLSKLRR